MEKAELGIQIHIFGEEKINKMADSWMYKRGDRFCATCGHAIPISMAWYSPKSKARIARCPYHHEIPLRSVSHIKRKWIPKPHRTRSIRSLMGNLSYEDTSTKTSSLKNKVITSLIVYDTDGKKHYLDPNRFLINTNTSASTGKGTIAE